MTLFEEIVDGTPLLVELRTNRDEDIKKAINNVLRVRIKYDDGKDRVISRAKGKNERYILPVAYGITKNGKRAIRAYQTAGSTKRGVPKWKLFLLDNIYMWSNGKKSFKQYKDTLIRLGLNTHGDKGMTTLFAITPLGDPDVPVAKDSSPVSSEPMYKSDISPETDTVQNPSMTDTEKFVPAATNNRASLDKAPDTTYTDNVGQVAQTKPVTKTEIDPRTAVMTGNTDNTDVNQEMPQQTTEPVTKGDIDNNAHPSADNGGQNGGAEENELTRTFRDLTDRMDNLYNNDEE